MKASNKGWDQCGNAQAVANEHQIILAADVTDQANDKRQMVPMVDQTRDELGCRRSRGGHRLRCWPIRATTARRIRRPWRRDGIDPYVATERLKHNEKMASAPRGRIPKDADGRSSGWRGSCGPRRGVSCMRSERG